MIDDERLGTAISILVFMLIPAVVCLTCFLMTRRKHAVETGKTPIYQSTCSVRINGPKHNFVRIALYEDYLVLMTILTNYVIPIQDLESATMSGGIYFGELADVLIDTRDNEAYPYLVIDTGEAEQFYKFINYVLKTRKTGADENAKREIQPQA